jgi:hypothetical protein
MKKHVHKAARAMEFCACGAIRADGGEWTEGKDPRAAALGHKTAAMSTPEERSRKAAAGGEGRWTGATKKQRSQYMSWMASLPRPSRRIEDRCACGKYSKTLAERRGHKCSPEEKPEETR